MPIVYCGRPGKWGNPFTLNDVQRTADMDINFGRIDNDYSRTVILRKYRAYLNENPQLVQRIKEELKGKNLSCWCRLDKECHVDIILKIANE